MNIKATKILILFYSFSLIFFLLNDIVAQKPRFKFKTFTQAEGLINHTIQALLEDSYGFLWIATQQGLQRYDGVSFKNYEKSYKDSSGLQDNFINALCEDEYGNIWIGGNNGLYKFDRMTEKISQFELKGAPTIDNVGFSIICIIKEKLDKNKLWFSAAGRGLYQFNINTGLYTQYNLSDNPLLNWTFRIIQHPGKDDILLVGTDRLQTLNKTTGKLSDLMELEQNVNPANNLINDLKLDPGNNEILWMATGDFWGQGNLGGLIRYNIRTGAIKKYFSDGSSKGLNTNHLISLGFYDNNNLWIGTRDNGLILFDKIKNIFYQFKRESWNKESFGTESAVLEILKDKSGSFWFGTWGDGLSFLSSASLKFKHYFHEDSNPNSLSDNHVNTFAEDKDGNIWIGTAKGGVNKFDPSQQTFTHLFKELWMDKKNPVLVTYIFNDSKNNIWVGTHNDGLYRFNPDTKEKNHYEEGKTESNVSKKRITSISEMGYGKIYITTYGGGLNIYEYSTNKFKHFINDPNDSTSIPDNQMWLPFTDDSGNVYFSGNSNTGLFKFDPKKEIFHNLNYVQLATATMPYKSTKGEIFVNSIDLGLQEIFIGDSISCKIIYTDNGHDIKSIEGILGGSQNDLWLSTTNGLINLDLQTRQIKKYDPTDGLQGFIFNRLAAFKASTGEIYFGGTNGFNVFHPNEIRLSNYEPPTRFTDFKLFNQSMPINDNSPLEKSILVSDKVILNYDQNDFSLAFAALDFAHSHKIKYKYILENHDHEWIDAGNKSFASYTNMDPGNYKFKVLATNGDGIWVKQPSQIEIIINPPWWTTTYAYVGYGIIFLLAVFSVDRIQRRRLLFKERTRSQIREAELRAKIAESENNRKTKELEEARELQLSMLPKELPKLPNLDIAVYMKTATEVGGDYYDFHIHPDGTLTVILGDATGHGMKAGMMVSVMKSLFMSDRSNKDLKPFFINTNNAIKDMQLERLLMALSCIQFNGKKLRTANAGMPSIYRYDNNTKTVEEIAINNMPLGAMKGFEYEVIEKEIKSGDTFLLITDGLPELQNREGELFGYKRIRNLFEDVAHKNPEQIVDYLKTEGIGWSNGSELEDDVTILVIKVKQ